MTEKFLNVLMALIIACVLLGALSIQFFKHEMPCPLCLLQRLGMIGLATGALLNLKFGIRKRHYGCSLISCFFGGFVALRHIALHACPGFPKFGEPFWGLSLYTWSFFLFSISVLYIGILLFAFDRPLEAVKSQKMPWWASGAFFLLLAATLINVVTTFMQCGFGPCVD